MKLKFVVLGMLCTVQLGIAQPGPFINSVPFSAGRGLSGSNWAGLVQNPDGSIMAKPNNNNVLEIGTTRLKALPVSKAAGFVNNYTVVQLNPVYFSFDGGVLKRRGDSLYPFIINPKIKYTYMLDSVMLVTNETALYLIKDSSLITIAKPVVEGQLLTDTVYIVPDVYSRKKFASYRAQNGSLFLFSIDEKNEVLVPYDVIHFPEAISPLVLFGKDSVILISKNHVYLKSATNTRRFTDKNNIQYVLSGQASDIFFQEGAHFRYKGYGDEKDFLIFNGEKPQGFLKDKFYSSYYAGGPKEIIRVFPHIKKYPAIYNGTNSSATHSLMQTVDGAIYAGSYNGNMARISNSGITSFNTDGGVLPGGLALQNNLYFFGEILVSNLSVYETKSKKTTSTKNTPLGYYIGYSRDSTNLLAGFSGFNGIGVCNKKDFASGKFNWTHIDSSKGVMLLNILTVTEDKYKRLWFGRTSEGWGVYYPESDKAQTFLMQKEQTEFGVVASICDEKGFVWLAGNKGLWYVDATKQKNFENEDAIKIKHPLVETGILINSLKQWGNYLVIGADRNILLLDLEKFHKKQVVMIKYLNPSEINLTSGCEQNTILVDKRDSSLWLATVDNLYNIDIKKWLSFPKYSVTPVVTITGQYDTITNLAVLQRVSLSAGTTAFNLQLHYQAKDNMPRYIQTAFAADGDSIIWSKINLENTNLFLPCKNGHYTFYVKVYQMDGSIDTFTYGIKVKKFLWENWWLWLLAFAIFALPVFLWLNAKRVHALQQKKLSQMNIVTLSNQFRPHFILNTLNTIGADLYDKPEAESVISRLGESINLIFGHAQQKRTWHILEQEWMLVNNVSEIHRLMYIPSLQLALPEEESIIKLKNLKLPLGILQIPVENALLHGLRNKRSGPYILKISIEEKEDIVCFEILDNGVGRKQAAGMSNFKNHGTGTKNLSEIIEILNSQHKQKISISYTDAFNTEKDCGTVATICIPKNYKYEF